METDRRGLARGHLRTQARSPAFRQDNTKKRDRDAVRLVLPSAALLEGGPDVVIQLGGVAAHVHDELGVAQHLVGM